MKTSLLITAACLCQISTAAPVHELMKREGFLSFLSSLLGDDSSSASPTTAAAPDTATTAAPSPTDAPAASGSASSGSKFNLDSLLSDGKVSQWLDFFGLGSDGDSEEAPTPTSTDESFPGFTFPGKQTSAATSTDYTPLTSSTVPTTFTTATTPPTTSTSTGTESETTQDVSGEDKEFGKQILDAHNKYRANHNAPALSWDQDAYEYAQKNADEYDCSGVLTHTHGPFGENLAAGFKDGQSAVKAWYVEGETYNYQSANTYDHFTQVVWKDTTKVGCAYKDCSKSGWQLYVVCEYDPPGNVIGRNKANVLQN